VVENGAVGLHKLPRHEGAAVGSSSRLQTHRETREAPIYELTVAKGGAKLQPSSEASCRPNHAGLIFRGAGETLRKPCGLFVAKARGTPGLVSVGVLGVTLDTMCESLSHILDRPVADKTGIQGKFDLHAEFVPDESTPAFRPGGVFARFSADTIAANAPGPSMFTAFQQQLGLKLEPAKGPREFLVVDHVDRPTAN